MKTASSAPDRETPGSGRELRLRPAPLTKKKNPRAPRQHLRLRADHSIDRARLTIDATGPGGIIGAVLIVVALVYVLSHCGPW